MFLGLNTKSLKQFRNGVFTCHKKHQWKIKNCKVYEDDDTCDGCMIHEGDTLKILENWRRTGESFTDE